MNEPVPITARFVLIDQDGASVTEVSYAGKYLLVFFGFTNCRVVCPRALRRLTRVLDRLGADARYVQPLYISVDPVRDTPDRLRQFLRDYHRNIRGCTGTAVQVDAAKHAFHVFAERKEDALDPDGYSVPHTAITYLLGPDGKYITHFLDSVREEELFEQIQSRITCDHAMSREQK